MVKEIYLPIDIKILFLILLEYFLLKNLMEFILHCYQYSSLLFSSNNLKFAVSWISFRLVSFLLIALMH